MQAALLLLLLPLLLLMRLMHWSALVESLPQAPVCFSQMADHQK